MLISDFKNAIQDHSYSNSTKKNVLSAVRSACHTLKLSDKDDTYDLYKAPMELLQLMRFEKRKKDTCNNYFKYLNMARKVLDEDSLKELACFNKDWYNYPNIINKYDSLYENKEDYAQFIDLDSVEDEVEDKDDVEDDVEGEVEDDVEDDVESVCETICNDENEKKKNIFTMVGEQMKAQKEKIDELKGALEEANNKVSELSLILFQESKKFEKMVNAMKAFEEAFIKI
ncbi:MAG: hypothetical protein RLY43_2289 [Bacteroidota bacterium]|jgi:hypothetical protein